MRITNNMMMRNYNTRLNKVLNDMNIANQKVTSKRKFLTSAESPADAARAYQLRRSFKENADYLSNVENIKDSYASAESSLMKISDLSTTVYEKTLEAINGTKSLDERKIYARELRDIQESMVMNLNSKFDDKFLFGGSGTEQPPFVLTTDTEGKQILTYRGINVVPDETDPVKYQEQMDALKYLADEKLYKDVGYGMREDGNGAIVNNSAFNSAMPGIDIIGYGSVDDNVILSIGKLADMLEQDPLNHEEIKKCQQIQDKQRVDLLVSVTKLGADTHFLSQTQDFLEDSEFNLNNKIVGVEYANMEEAIMAFKEADYIYKAALKMGMNILSPSFIDFMN